MSIENVKKFYEALKADEALAEELQTAVNAVVLQFAAKQNLAFTAEELTEFETEARKLSDEELDQVNAAGWVGDIAVHTRDLVISRGAAAPLVVISGGTSAPLL